MLSGPVKGTPFITLIGQIMRQTGRGRIIFTMPGNVKTLFFEDRHITGSSSNDPSDYLGQYLINEGVITLEQFNRAYQAQLETDVRMAQVLQLIGLAPVDKLREAIIAKTVDTAFLVSCWQEGSWEVNDAYPKAVSGVEIGLTVDDLSTHLLKRQEQFARIIQMFRELGDTPNAAIANRDLSNIKKLDLMILNLIAIGKTLRETFTALPVHFYVVARHMIELHRAGFLLPGAGTPLNEMDIFQRLTAASGVSKPQDIEQISADETAKIYRSAHDAMGKKDYWKAAEQFHILCNINPHNVVFKDSLHNAEYHYTLYFYRDILPPAARMKKGIGIGILSDPMEQKILDLMGTNAFSVREIVGYFADKVPEVKLLNILERLIQKKYLVEAK
ncbi:MAG TPA: hypothetical protein PLV42_04525 [bacterium]|nr:hypothetical protein [bacterium]